MDHHKLVAGKLNLVATLISKMQSKHCVVETTTVIAIVKYFPNHFPIPTVRVTKNNVRMTWKLFPPFKIDLIVTKDNIRLSYSYPGDSSTIDNVPVDEICDHILHIFATGEMHEVTVIMRTFSEIRSDVETFLANMVRKSNKPNTAVYWKSKVLIGDIPDDWDVPNINVDEDFATAMFAWDELQLSIRVSKDGYRVMRTNGVGTTFITCQTMEEVLKLMLTSKENYDQYKTNNAETGK